MANEEHVRILKENGVEAWNQYAEVQRRKDKDWSPKLRSANLRAANLGEVFLGDADLIGTNLSSARLSGAYLGYAYMSGANLRAAFLRRANLRGANLFEADLSSANLSDANLIETDLKGAKLSNTGLRSAYMRGADLTGADLKGADLSDANLEDADLKDANLSNANLRGAKLLEASLEGAHLFKAEGFRLDGNYTRDIKLSPRAKDPWSVLRRNYTGAKMPFHLLLVALFLLPWVSRALMWVGVNQGHKSMMATQAQLKELSTRLEAEGTQTETLHHLIESLDQAQPCLVESCKSYEVWQVLLGLDKGWWFVVFGALLLLFNLGRGLLTVRVGPLADEEARSHHAPRWDDYKWLFWTHRYVVSVLFFASIGAFAYNAWHWLRVPVFLPG